MKDTIGRIQPAGGLDPASERSTLGGGTFEDAVRDAVAPALSESPAGVGGVDALAARLDAKRAAFDSGVSRLRSRGDAVSLAKVAVLQNQYTTSAQVAVRGIQKTVQAINDLTRLQ